MATKNIKKAAKKEAEELEEAYEESMAENEGGKVTVELEGKEFELPPTPPLWFQVFIRAGTKKQYSEAEYMDKIIKLLGFDVIDHLIDSWDNETPLNELENVLEKVMQAWIKNNEKKRPKKKDSTKD